MNVDTVPLEFLYNNRLERCPVCKHEDDKNTFEVVNINYKKSAYFKKICKNCYKLYMNKVTEFLKETPYWDEYRSSFIEIYESPKVYKCPRCKEIVKPNENGTCPECGYSQKSRTIRRVDDNEYMITFEDSRYHTYPFIGISYGKTFKEACYRHFKLRDELDKFDEDKMTFEGYNLCEGR